MRRTDQRPAADRSSVERQFDEIVATLIRDTRSPRFGVDTGECIAFGAQRVDDLTRERPGEIVEERFARLLGLIRLLTTLLRTIAGRRHRGLDAFAD